MTGKRSARTPAKVVEPSPRQSGGVETPRAPEEVKKRHKGAEEAASKSPKKIPTPSIQPSAASGSKGGLRSASKSNQNQQSSDIKGESAIVVAPFTMCKIVQGKNHQA